MFSPFREPTTRTDNSLKKEAPLTVSLQPGIELPLFLGATFYQYFKKALYYLGFMRGAIINKKKIKILITFLFFTEI